jgi:hypothetical protein
MNDCTKTWPHNGILVAIHKGTGENCKQMSFAVPALMLLSQLDQQLALLAALSQQEKEEIHANLWLENISKEETVWEIWSLMECSIKVDIRYVGSGRYLLD